MPAQPETHVQPLPPMSWPSAAELKVVSSPNPHVDLLAPAKVRTVALLRDLAPELALMGVTKVALFGSVARGDDREDSDIDIAVSTVNPRDFQLRASVRRLVEVHCNRRVDVVPLPLRYPLSEVAGDELLDVG